MKEREISLIDLVVELLLKWRVFVILMIVGAVALGAFGYTRTVNNAEAQKTALIATEEELAEKQQELEKITETVEETQLVSLTEGQRNNVLTTLSYEQFSADKRAYLETSVWINLDPMKIACTTLTFRVTGRDRETSYDIEKLYEDVFAGGVCRWVAQESNNKLKETELDELITLSRTSRSWADGADSFSVAVYHRTEEESEELAQSVIAYVEHLEQELGAQVGAHEIELVAKSFSYIISTSLQDAQRNIQANILSWNATAASLKAQFSEVERLYYNKVVADLDTLILELEKKELSKAEFEVMIPTSGKEPLSNPELEAEVLALEEKLATMTVSTPGLSMKYVILGAVLFAFMYAFIVFLMYIFNNKLRATDNLQDIYNISQLGVISGENKEKRKFLGVIDAWILKLRYRNVRRFTHEEAVNLAAVATNLAVKKQNINKVCLMGCNLTGKTLETCELIKGRLETEGASVQILSNVLYDAEVMEELSDAGCAVLVETADSTLYDEIAKELELLGRQNIAVLGGIVVE